MNTGLSLLSFQMTTGGPVSISMLEAEAEHYHYSCDMSASRDILAYTHSFDTVPTELYFVLCRTHTLDRQLLTLTSFEVPFVPRCTYFDAFSSRAAFYIYPFLHIGSFVVPRS